jgi:hypothetical protein
MTNLELSTEAWLDKKSLKRFLNGVAQVGFHVLLVALSAGIALSLPYVVGFIGNNFWAYWSIIEKQTVYLISVETITAIVLLLVFNYIGRGWKDRKISRMAKSAGLVYFLPAKSVFAQRKIKRLKLHQGFARDVMIISSTGYRTFVDPRGDLHGVLQHCRGARIMLLNPRSEGAYARARSILDPSVTPETFSEQFKKSVDFLKGLRAGKNIRLKLYDDTPFLKLAILGDHVWIKHYHPGLDVQSMPEYLFEHEQNLGGFYTPFYHYFLARWENPATAEYDLETHELIYRDASGKEISREKTDTLYQPSNGRQTPREELFPHSSISPS